MEISPEELESFLAILEAIEYCMDNPASMGSAAEARAEVQEHIGVGQVSSSRPVGVNGLIPVGSETNALDAMAEDAKLPNGGQ